MDHYRTLGVKRSATKKEIERAYRKLALKCHPDKSDAPDAADKFRIINEAYEVLKDSNKRDVYDRFDLTQASVSSNRSHRDGEKHSHRHRTHYDDSFYTGRSETYRKERAQQDELDRIRAINKKLLEETNAKLQSRSSKSHRKEESANRSANSGLYSHIMPHLDDDEFERITLDRLRSVARSEMA